MAQLPPDGEYLVQQTAGRVSIFQRYTERELLVVESAADGNSMAKAQKAIHELDELTAEQKSFAHFWFGYFYCAASLQAR